MREIIKFFVDLAIPFILVFAGIGMVAVSFEYQITWLFWGGLLVMLFGVIRGLWLLISNGVSIFGD